MTKTTLKLIGNLNILYDRIWHEWQKTVPDSPEFLECTQKMKLIRKIAKQTEEQSRGFLKSKIDYKKGGEFILENEKLPYVELHKGVTQRSYGGIDLNVKPMVQIFHLTSISQSIYYLHHRLWHIRIIQDDNAPGTKR